MWQAHHVLEVATQGRGLCAFTEDVERWLAQLSPSPREGLLTLFLQHTSAGLLLQENADPDVQVDLNRWLSRLVRDGDALFTHTTEGPDDMPAHVRAALTGTQLCIPVHGGQMTLGTWQGLYVFEHRMVAHRRRVVLHYLGS